MSGTIGASPPAPPTTASKRRWHRPEGSRRRRPLRQRAAHLRAPPAHPGRASAQAAAGGVGTDAPSWLRYKLHVPRLLREHLAYEGLVLSGLHPRSHAASAFYPSPFDRAAIGSTLNGVGEWSTGSIGVGDGREVRLLQETRFPHSIGLLYSAFTELAGFALGSGERAMAALARHGDAAVPGRDPRSPRRSQADGSIELDLREYFTFPPLSSRR